MNKLSGLVFLLITFIFLQGTVSAHEIHHAVIKGDLSEVKYLLQKNPHALNAVTEMGLSPLHLAAELGYLDIVKLLIEKGASVNAYDVKNMTPLHWASLYGHTKVLEYLLANKANIKSRDKCNRTPLHLAAGSDNIKTVMFLVESGAETTAKDQHGATLQISRFNGPTTSF